MKHVLDMIELKKVASKKQVSIHAFDYNESQDEQKIQIGGEFVASIDLPRMEKLSKVEVCLGFTSARVSNSAKVKMQMSITTYKKHVKIKTQNITSEHVMGRKHIARHKLGHVFNNAKIGSTLIKDATRVEIRVKILEKNFTECISIMRSSLKLTLVE